MSAFIRTLCGRLVNSSHVESIRPFNDSWDRARFGALSVSDEFRDRVELPEESVVVLTLRNTTGEDGVGALTFFACVDDWSALEVSTLVPASPGWSVRRFVNDAPDPTLVPEPVVAWAMPGALPVVPLRGVVRPSIEYRLVQPDGAVFRNKWAISSADGRLVWAPWGAKARGNA